MKVKNFMIPLSEYATVSEEANLSDVVTALEKAQEDFDKTSYRHRAVLVCDKDKNVVGKVSQLDVLKTLEPKYDEMGLSKSVSRFGLSANFLHSMFHEFNLFDESLPRTCKKVGKMKVTEFMYTPTEGEYVDEGATLSMAIHQLVMGHHQSLLVTRSGKIVGVLRLTDVFMEIVRMVRE